MMIPRVRSRTHLDFIRQLCCTICGDGTTIEAAHIRFADPRAAKPITGIGTKAADCFVVPLCGHHHREQHAYGNGRGWWSENNKDPIFIALALWHVSGDHEAGVQIIGAART
jgi:hypothetical protein